MAETDQTEIEEQLAVWEARGDGKTAQEEPRGPAKVIQLPLWPEPKRGAPNAVLRGALFAAVHKDRRYMDRELLAAQDGIKVWFTGKQLDQSDLDVWEQVLHLARTQALGTECYFTAHGFLKALGRSTGKMNHEWLQMALERLTGAVVRISDGRWTYFGSLIEAEPATRTLAGMLWISTPSWPSSTAAPSGHRSTGSSASNYAASPWRCGCTASMPATPRPTR